VAEEAPASGVPHWASVEKAEAFADSARHSGAVDTRAERACSAADFRAALRAGVAAVPGGSPVQAAAEAEVVEEQDSSAPRAAAKVEVVGEPDSSAPQGAAARAVDSLVPVSLWASPEVQVVAAGLVCHPDAHQAAAWAAPEALTGPPDEHPAAVWPARAARCGHPVGSPAVAGVRVPAARLPAGSVSVAAFDELAVGLALPAARLASF
jgi:hypothetical protein